MSPALTRRRCMCGGVLSLLNSGRSASAAPLQTLCRVSLRNGWHPTAPRHYTLLRIAGPNDSSGIPQATTRILQALSFPVEFEIRITDGEDNAMTQIENNKRIMTVDLGFLISVNRLAATRWAAIQILSHEVGHHLARADDSHHNELEADYWSGRALRLLGSARDAASASILAIGTEKDTETHPNKYLRARAIEKGWDQAFG